MISSRHLSWKTIFWKAWLIAALLSMVGVTVALAASGALDTTYHGTGKWSMDVASGQWNLAYAVAVQSDGKIVSVGESDPSSTNWNVAVTRFTSAGQLDTTFNGTGKKAINLGGYDRARSVVVTSAGKIVMVAEKCQGIGSGCDLAVLRLNANGSMDTTFNGTGKVITDFGGDDNGSFGGLALQSDGKIVVAGYMYNTATSDYDFAVLRYKSGGGLDTTFNGTGKQSIAFGTGRSDDAYALAIQPADGKIVVAGSTCDTSYVECNFALARLNTNGSLDTTFSADGKQVTDLGGKDQAQGLALQSNGKIVLVGRSQPTPSSGKFALARYNAGGSLDTTFNGTGKKLVDFSGTGYSWAYAVRVVPSTQKILVCGQSAGNFALGRFTTAGALDTTFHSTGKVTVDFGGYDDCHGLAIQADGKYLLVGGYDDSTITHWASARILP